MGDYQLTIAAGRLIAKEKAPYFNAMIHGLVVTVTEAVETMAVTDNGLLLVNPMFASLVTPEQMAGLLCHEIMHVTCGHVTAARVAGRDRRYLGVAQDLAINPSVIDMGFQLPTGELAGVFPETDSFPKAEGFVRGLTQDEYYDLLLKREEKRQQQKQQQKKQGKGQDQPKPGKGKGGKGGEGEPQDPNDEQGEGGNGGDDDHDHDGDGDHDPQLPKKPQVGKGWCGSCSARPEPNEPKEKEGESMGARSEQEMHRMMRAVAEAVQEAAKSSASRGRMPAMLQRWADDLLKPPTIPWHTKLRRAELAALAWVAGAVDQRYDGPSRRQAGLGYGAGRPILPRLRAPKPIIDIVGDTSGSMSKNELSVVCSESWGVVRQCNATVRFAACDAHAHGITKIESQEALVNALVGGGGTDMRPAFDALMKQTPRPKVIVCITDGLVGDGFPKRPPPGVRVIIVLCGPHAQPIPGTEWAETIVVPPGAKIEDDQEDAA